VQLGHTARIYRLNTSRHLLSVNARIFPRKEDFPNEEARSAVLNHGRNSDLEKSVSLIV